MAVEVQPGFGERGLPVRDRQPRQREPDGEQDDDRVVELSGHRNDSRHEVDGRDKVGGPGEERRAARPRQPLVAGEMPGQTRVAGKAAEERGEPIARERVARAVVALTRQRA